MTNSNDNTSVLDSAMQKIINCLLADGRCDVAEVRYTLKLYGELSYLRALKDAAMSISGPIPEPLKKLMEQPYRAV